jgi:hypothetical protein
MTSANEYLQISTNVYIVGYASATVYYGDGSQLTGISAGGGGGDPDICGSYSGDLFISTTTYNDEGLWGGICKQSLTVATYDFVISSATTDGFNFIVSNRTLGSSWSECESVSIPAAVSTHTFTSSGYTISAGEEWKVDITGVNTSDPAGKFKFKIGN